MDGAGKALGAVTAGAGIPCVLEDPPVEVQEVDRLHVPRKVRGAVEPWGAVTEAAGTMSALGDPQVEVEARDVRHLGAPPWAPVVRTLAVVVMAALAISLVVSQRTKFACMRGSRVACSVTTVRRAAQV